MKYRNSVIQFTIFAYYLHLPRLTDANGCQCWSDRDCFFSQCGTTCRLDWATSTNRCFGDWPFTPPPVPPPTTPAPTPPTAAGDLIPDTCQVARLIELMDRAVRANTAIAPQWLRLAFHDAGTFNQNTNEGGANGCLLTNVEMMNQEENHDLELAIETLEVIRDSWGVRVSNADMIQFAGNFVAVRQRGVPGFDNDGGLKLFEAQNGFLWGRPDTLANDCRLEWTKNLPGFQSDTDILDDIPRRCAFAGGEIQTKMIERNGFTAREATALLGAHSIGLTRNVFGQGLKGPWVDNGADDATPEGPVFDNDYHRFLFQDVRADSASAFANDRTPFDEDFPNWFRANRGGGSGLNHLDTDMALAFPSEDLAVHPHFNFFTEQFANDNDLFIMEFMRALRKMSALGVPNDKLVGPKFCEPPVLNTGFGGAVPVPAPPIFGNDPFESDLQESIQVATENLENLEIERQEEIEFLTTPLEI